jgi:hypothetical protein
MNRFIISLLLGGIILIPGCSKEPSVKEPIKGTFSFTANGEMYDWSFKRWEDSYDVSFPHISKDHYNPEYDLIGQVNAGGIGSIGLGIQIMTDTLKEDTYTLTTTVSTDPHHGCVLVTNGTSYSGSQIGDFGTVTISKIHDGNADGTFVALLTSNDPSLSKLNITNGEFKNLKIVTP